MDNRSKIGDYITCKKTFSFGRNIYFHENERYLIENINVSNITFTSIENYTFNVVYILKGEPYSEYFLSQHFYSKQEERKIKLQNINNIKYV